jgi:pantoate--beta-alanine ligase
MKIIHTIIELREFLAKQASIAFVPTMGNLHEGHLTLMREARQYATCVVASVFVNPLQFGPNEDFDRYPRTLDADCEKLQGLVDVVFAPSVSEMYPLPQVVFIEPPAIANELCGASRPGHFRGMATVVLKLLNIVQPHVALFGKKDYQQLHIIRQMATQLNLAVQIVGGETVRAADGLALSSRNQYLDETQRSLAPALYRGLQTLREQMLQGRASFPELSVAMSDALSAQGWQVDYLSLRNRVDLSVINKIGHAGVILIAAQLGNTRLLDNIEVCLVG